MDNETKPQESQEHKQLESVQDFVKPTQEPEKDKGGRPENCGHCHKPKRPDSKEYDEQDEYCHCGQPKKIDEGIVQKLIEAFRIGLKVRKACAYAQIGKTTYYKKLNENEEFADEMEWAQAYITIKAQSNIAGSITRGNVSDSWRWIEHEDPTPEVIDMRHSGGISNELYTPEDDEDPDIKEARENLQNKRRALWQRRAIEKDTRLKELQAQKAKKNE